MSAAGRAKPPAKSAPRLRARRRAAAASPAFAVTGGAPTHTAKLADAPHPDLHPFRPQQLALHLQVSAVAANGAARRDDAVARNAGLAAGAHDVADSARRARLAG